eukprot:376307-Hanusia_phi.AAC.1
MEEGLRSEGWRGQILQSNDSEGSEDDHIRNEPGMDPFCFLDPSCMIENMIRESRAKLFCSLQGYSKLDHRQYCGIYTISSEHQRSTKALEMQNCKGQAGAKVQRSRSECGTFLGLMNCASFICGAAAYTGEDLQGWSLDEERYAMRCLSCSNEAMTASSASSEPDNQPKRREFFPPRSRARDGSISGVFPFSNLSRADFDTLPHFSKFATGKIRAMSSKQLGKVLENNDLSTAEKLSFTVKIHFDLCGLKHFNDFQDRLDQIAEREFLKPLLDLCQIQHAVLFTTIIIPLFTSFQLSYVSVRLLGLFTMTSKSIKALIELVSSFQIGSKAALIAYQNVLDVMTTCLRRQNEWLCIRCHRHVGRTWSG